MTEEPKFLSKISVKLIQKMGGDHMIVAAARVSTSGEEAVKWADAPADDNYGLIKYLMKQRHGTPFEHASLTFFVHAPVFVWWEWVRHRIGVSFNLESGRYKVLSPVFWLPERNRPMTPSNDHKPARPKFDIVSESAWQREVDRIKKASIFSYEMYEESLADGICTEVARTKLPFNIYYSGWVTCNPRSLMSFLSLRTHDPKATFISYPQAEIEEAARAIESVFMEGWPLAYKAFNECGRVAP